MDEKQILWQKKVLREDDELTENLKQFFNKDEKKIRISAEYFLKKKARRIKNESSC